MTASGIHTDDFSKRFQSLNEISIPGHRQNPGNPGEELFAEFQDVLDKIAVALSAGDETGALADILEFHTPPAEVKPKEPVAPKATQESKPAAPVETETETKTKPDAKAVVATEKNSTQATAQQVAESEDSKVQEVQEEEEAEEIEISASESEAAEEELVEEATSESVQVETEQAVQLATQVETSTTVKQVETKADDRPAFEATESENFNESEQKSQDPELAKAVKHNAKPAEQAQTSQKAGEEVIESAPVESGEEKASLAVKQFMESLKARLQSTTNRTEERAILEKPVENIAPVVQSPQQNAAMVLSQLILKTATQGSGEATKGLPTAVENVMNASTRHDTSRQIADESAEAKEAHRLPRNYESKTLAKVEEALKEVARSRDGKTISVRLDPPSLGQVKIDVSVRDGVLHARLQADSTQVSTLLREHGLDLQYALRKLGLNVDEVTVAVVPDPGSSNESFQNFTEHGGSNGQTNEQQGSLFTPSGVAGSAEGVSTVEVSTAKQAELDDHWVA